MKKFLAFFVILVVMVSIVLAGISCKEETTPAEEAVAEEVGKVTIGISYASLDIEFFKLYQKGIKAKADELGINLIEEDSQYDPEKQIDSIDRLLAQDLDVIIIHAVEETAVVPGVDKANEQDVPVFALDRKPTGGDYAYLSAGHEQIGQLQAEFIAECIDGEGTVAFIKGMAGESYTEILYEKAMEVFDEKYPDIEIVFVDNADWDREVALRKTEDLLTTYPDIDAIIYHADMMAMGGLEAIKAAGKLDQISIIGGDADLDMLQAIKRGEVEGTVDPRPVESGMIALEACFQIATEGKIVGNIKYADGPEDVNGEQTLFLSVQVIDINNVDSTMAWGEVDID